MPKAQESGSSRLTRRAFLKAAGASTAAMGLSSGCPCPGNPNGYPNVLLVMVDQMRLPQWFPPDFRLPAYDRLLREGLLFDNFFTSAVPCSASRATIFTGLHQPTHGISTNVAIGLIPGDGSLDPRLPTLGHVFQDAGYRTPYFGKWHLTERRDYHEAGLSDYGFEGWQGPDPWGLPFQGTRKDADFVDQAIRWLQWNGTCAPWFMTCSLVNPHDIMYYRRFDLPPYAVPDMGAELPSNFGDTLEDKPRVQTQYRDAYGALMGTPPDAGERVWREYVDYYCYLTQQADTQMGRLLEALDRYGLTNDTIVVFVSDHGEMAGAHRLQSKGPFVYQENNLIPCVVRWPGRVAAGARTGALAQTVDLFPTLIDMTGIPASRSHLPGRSLVPAVLGGQDVNDHVLMVFPYSNSDDFTQLAGVGRIPDITAPMQVRAICDGRYKFARYFDRGMADEEYELYDLVNDPLEMRNLAGDPAHKFIRRDMELWLGQAEAAEMPPADPDWLRTPG
jgi:arylsulfatase A-like enzyme